jgi:ubiquinone/menaquinone biosynthesis C-methylase UbiE
LNSQQEGSDQINEFYRWIRDYLADLSRSTDGELSHAINFGYWAPSCKNLFDAEMAFFDLVVDMLSPLAPGDHGVEIGCGIGGYAARLLEKHPVNLTCYDLLEEHLSLTRKFAEDKSVADRLTTIQGNSMEMDNFENDSLDFVYCIESSFHYDEKQKFFNEVCRVLKPGATFVYADISCEDPSKVTFQVRKSFFCQRRIQHFYKRCWS